MSLRDASRNLAKGARRVVPAVKCYEDPAKSAAGIPERPLVRSPFVRLASDRSGKVGERVEKRRSSPPKGGEKRRKSAENLPLAAPNDSLSHIPLKGDYDLDSTKFFRGVLSASRGKRSSPTKGTTSPGPRSLILGSPLEGRRVGPGTLSRAKRGIEGYLELVDWATEMEQKALRVGKLQSKNAELRRSRDAAVVETTKEKVDSLVKEKLDVLVREQVKEIDKRWATKLEKKTSEKQALAKELEIAKRAAEEAEAARLEAVRAKGGYEKYFVVELEEKYAEGWTHGNALTREAMREFCPTFDWAGFGVIEARKIEEAREGSPAAVEHNEPDMPSPTPKDVERYDLVDIDGA